MIDFTQYFPYKTYRENQLETIEQCIEWFNNGIDIIIIDAPVGFGKSPVNLTLGLYFAPSYYTTPQKKLREQLGTEFGPQELAIDIGNSDIVVLKARKDYICRASDQDSEECKCRSSEKKEKRCSNNPKCTYWKQKEALFHSKCGILTFSNLIVNSYLPLFNTTNDEEKQISFEPRELLIIDECHSLEEQVASLHAGFKITPNSFPDIEVNNKNLRLEMWNDIQFYLPKGGEIEAYSEFLEQTKEVCRDYLNERYFRDEKDKQKINNLINKIEYVFKELEENRKWIVNNEYLKSWDCQVPYFKPIRIDRFLQNHIWKYGSKYLLTSGTIPFRNNIPQWLNRIGLGKKKFEILKVPMSFPKENRPIYLNKIGGSLSFKNKRENWNGCVQNISEILEQYKGKQGVIHVSSYQMMWDLFNSLKGKRFSIYLHDKYKLDGKDIVSEWIQSRKNILISPAIFEGVDLKYDLCRFQILFKVPFANLQDNRVKYLLYKERDQEWYNNETMMKIAQAYGRAIRAKDDKADFYIIDGDFLPFYQKVVFPEWFKEAIVR